MRSGESSIEQKPDTRICVVQRISYGMKECEGDGCPRKSAAVGRNVELLDPVPNHEDNHSFLKSIITVYLSTKAKIVGVENFKDFRPQVV